MQHILDEIARRKQQESLIFNKSTCTGEILSTLDALLQNNDREFLIQAYRSLLDREPDHTGLEFFLDRLASGSTSKIDILREIRYSPEGKHKSTQIIGLLPPIELEWKQVISSINSINCLEDISHLFTDNLSSPYSYLGEKPFYSLSEFLQFHNTDFVKNAYLTLLCREPDPDALQYYSIRLSQGSLTKVDILGRLRYSREGRLTHKKIKGLLLPFIIQLTYHIPILGHLLSAVSLLVNSRKLIRRIRTLEEQADYQTIQNNAFNNRMSKLEAINLRAIKKFQQMVGYFQQLATCQAIEFTQLKLVADTKTNHSELSCLKKRLQDFVQTKTVVDHSAESLTQLKTLLHSKPDTNDLTQLAQQLQATIAAKASAADLAQLAQQLHATVNAKASTDDLAQLAQQLHANVNAKASTDDLIYLAHQLQANADAKASTDDLVQYTQQVQSLIDDLRNQLRDHKRTILDQQRRLSLLLEETRKRLPKPLDTEQLNMLADAESHRLDAMYATFEDHFRGTRKDIKERQSIYLTIIRNSGAGFEKSPVLDIGCGRGEWLELLRENKLTSYGVDLNDIFVRQCQEDQLNVVKQDALVYLRGLQDDTLGAITGFHIIEHLPINSLVSLLDEAIRVLRPGGVVIFETPNPENLVVGACNFYMDPTHRNPLPPEMSLFLVEARGFVQCEIKRVNRQELSDPIAFLEPGFLGAKELNALIQITNDYYFAAPDYAVIGYKA